MTAKREIDDPRRMVLVRALSAGLLYGSLSPAQAITFGFFGGKPAKLPDTQSIYRMSGDVSVNARAATMDTRIRPGDTVKTGNNSEIVFVVGTNSMILRQNSQLDIEPPPGLLGALLIGGLGLLTGALLSVSRDTAMRVSSPTATIGIRGTGFYIEADPERTYFCNCYGVTDVQASGDAQSRETLTSTNHGRPVYILAQGAAGGKIRSAPFINHTDQELALIETLVGRERPFVFPRRDYNAPRRTY